MIRQMGLIYHYTTGQYLKDILESGELIVSEWERKNKIKPPALWLSLNPDWEPTATKMIKEAGRLRDLTKEEQHQKIGLIRFVLEFNKSELCSWRAYRYKSNTPQDVYEGLESVGINRGANPQDWYASFKNIPLDKCLTCERWDGSNWMEVVNFRKGERWTS